MNKDNTAHITWHARHTALHTVPPVCFSQLLVKRERMPRAKQHQKTSAESQEGDKERGGGRGHGGNENVWEKRGEGDVIGRKKEKKKEHKQQKRNWN